MHETVRRPLHELFGGVRLDATASAPLYAQIELLLRARIRDGVFKAGDRLPTEKQLQQHFRVSRVTVRQAFGNLVRDGLISRCRGRGSQVNPSKIEVQLGGRQGFTEAMEDLGFKVYTQVITDGECTPPDDVAVALGTSNGEKVWHLERLRIVQNERVVHFHHYLPLELRPQSGDPVGMSLYRYLDTRRLRPQRNQECVEAVSAGIGFASKLGVPLGSPLLRRVRVGRASTEQVVEYSVGHYRGDRYRYMFNLDAT